MVACTRGEKPGIRSSLGFLENILIEQEVLGRTNRLLSFHYKLKVGLGTDRIENMSNSSAVVFLAEGTCLLNRFLAITVYYDSTIPSFRRHVTLLPP
jgi:hypothetical protein